ncbi:MAG: hypothetical protein WBV89_08950 [Ilumatobacter sp.]
MTPIIRSTSRRARTDLGVASASAHVCAPTHVAAFSAAVAMSTATATEMNLWLGGDVQGSGFGSKYATKRIAPGRLEGMT